MLRDFALIYEEVGFHFFQKNGSGAQALCSSIQPEFSCFIFNAPHCIQEFWILFIRVKYSASEDFINFDLVFSSEKRKADHLKLF